MRFWLLCDGLCLECWRIIYCFASSCFVFFGFSFFVVSFSRRSLYIVILDIAPPFALIFFGGGGSCRRQGKSVQTDHSAAPEGACGVVDVVG